ncbi:MAG: PAS-domain containing protein [Tabrizicola sp.]|nr:PAS-domain containing protein [Tabrizicola sp.]
MTQDLLASFGLVLSSALIALSSLAVLIAWQMRRPGKVDSIFAPGQTAAAFLFHGDRLLDATPAGRSLLPEGADGRALSRLMVQLGPLFPDLGQALDTLPGRGQILLPSAPEVRPPLVLKGEYLRGLTRLTMLDAESTDRPEGADVPSLAALQHEVAAQRAVLSRAPVLMWKEDQQGTVIWANHAYLIRATELLPEGEDLSWPLPKLFQVPEGASRRPPRIKLQMRSGPEWFDLSRIPMGSEVLNYALAANAAVDAETALREFMQTLTKTFADLPIGLAIFDRSRVLQLFNPALADLTSLAPDFLISRPTLSAVLDAMRAKAMIPEPKDYRSWRKQLMKVEEEASSGLFEETWSLPGGQTYRVIGRPHPNGALAFMFEDISTEMTRSRRYRADLELGQSVIDSLDEAVAVFSQGGQLVMSNQAYAQLWQHDPAVMLSDAGIVTLCAWWQQHSAPSLIWDDARAFVSSTTDRTRIKRLPQCHGARCRWD